MIFFVTEGVLTSLCEPLFMKCFQFEVNDYLLGISLTFCSCNCYKYKIQGGIVTDLHSIATRTPLTVLFSQLREYYCQNNLPNLCRYPMLNLIRRVILIYCQDNSCNLYEVLPSQLQSDISETISISVDLFVSSLLHNEVVLLWLIMALKNLAGASQFLVLLTLRDTIKTIHTIFAMPYLFSNSLILACNIFL